MSHPRRPRLVLNPTLQLTAVAEVSRRRHGRTQVTVGDAQAVRFLLAAVAGGRPAPRLSADVRQRLLADGVIVAAGDVPRDVVLDARLAPPAPEAGGARPTAPRERTVVTNCQVLAAPALPVDVAARAATSETFLPAGDVLWVRDPGSRITLPYTLGRRLAATARRLTSAAGDALSPALMATFATVGVETRGGAIARRRSWAHRLDGWQHELRGSGFAVVRALFPPLFLDALRTYYRALDREGYLLGGDKRRAGYPLVQGEPVLHFLAGQLASVVRQITGERVATSFSPYLRIYEPGAVLERHRDHAVCRWNVDLVVGGDPAPTRSTSSPILIDTGGRVAAVRLGLGDALLYRGTDVEHWRRPHPARRTTAMASLHYGAPRP